MGYIHNYSFYTIYFVQSKMVLHLESRPKLVCTQDYWGDSVNNSYGHAGGI